MKISVIIPVYNAERYLARCLDSVLAAAARLTTCDARSATEVICINDGSTDGSAEILRRYSDRVRVIDKANGGQGSARNAGLDAMTGDGVLFVDADDYIVPEALAEFVRVARESGAPVVSSMSFACDVRRPPSLHAGRVRWRLRTAASMAGEKVQYSVCNKLFRAEVLAGRRFLPVKFEDFAYAVEVFCDIGEFAAINEPLYVYCRNEGAPSTVHSPFDLGKVRNSLTVVRHVLDHARDRPCRPFALRQAADGLSSTIGKTYRAGERASVEELRAGCRRLFADFPDLKSKLTLRARFRLWRMR